MAYRTDTLYVSDLDGTLLSPETKLTPATVGILNRVIGEGGLFTVATARTPATVSTLLSDVDLRLPAVVMTGVALWDRRSGRYSDVKHIAAADARRLLSIYSEGRLPLFLYTLSDDIIDIYHLGGPLSPAEQQFVDERAHTPFKRFHIPASGESELPESLDDVILLFALQPDNLVKGVYDSIAGHPGWRPMYYRDIYNPIESMMEAFPPDASKAEAVRRLARSAGAGRIVAFGDNFNDIPMLRAADVAVAVGNAVDEVKAMADVVIGTNDTDAVARWIESDFFGTANRL